MADYGQVVKHPTMELFVMVIAREPKGFSGYVIADRTGFHGITTGEVSRNFGSAWVTADEADPSRSKWIVIDEA